MPSDVITAAAPAPPHLPESSAVTQSAGVREMDRGELHLYLRGHGWGVLSTLHEGRPYAVPVSFGFDGEDVYVASGPGRKLRALEGSPGVCLTVADVTDRTRWSSVVVIADAIPVHSLRERLHALSTLRRQQAEGGPPSAKDLARAAGATVFRLSPLEVSGRVCR